MAVKQKFADEFKTVTTAEEEERWRDLVKKVHIKVLQPKMDKKQKSRKPQNN